MASRVSDTSKARDFITENKDKITRKELFEEIMKFTKLKESTIRNIYNKMMRDSYSGYEIPTGIHTQKAKEFIENKLYTNTKEEIIMYIEEDTILSRYTIEKIYESIAKEKKVKPKEVKEERNSCKNRERSFFRFDVSNLWRTV